MIRVQEDAAHQHDPHRRRHQPDQHGVPGRVEAVHQPVPLHRDRPDRAALGRVVLAVPLPPLGIGDGGRDDRHRLVLLVAEVGEQRLGQRLQRGDQLGPAVRPGPVAAGGGQHPLQQRLDHGVLGAHPVQHRRRVRVAVPDHRPQAGVLGLVVVVQEVHHPQQVLGDRDPLRVRWGGRPPGRLPDAGQVTPQRVVDHTHDGRVGGRTGRATMPGSSHPATFVPMTSPLSLSVPVEGGSMPADLHLPASGRGPGIVLFQEIFGVTAYVDDRARDLAGLGYVVLVPHVYWRQGDPVIPDGEDALPRALAAMGQVEWPAAVADGAAALAALRARPEVAGPVGLVGFCFGGGLAFAVAAAAGAAGTGADVLVSYYGSALPNLLDSAPQVTCPSLHHFGLADDYLPPEVVRRIEAAVTADGNATVLTYPGAGHAFDNPSPLFHHEEASRQAWAATAEWLGRTLPTAAGG